MDTEELSGKTEEEPNNEQLNIEKTKSKLEVPNKRKAAWTEERKAAQRLRMAKVIGAGKAYKGKKPKQSEESGGDEEEYEYYEEEETSNTPIVIILLVVIVVILGSVFYLKRMPGVKDVEGEKYE